MAQTDHSLFFVCLWILTAELQFSGVSAIVGRAFELEYFVLLIQNRKVHNAPWRIIQNSKFLIRTTCRPLPCVFYVFVKALPDNICISDAQYCQLSAQQNLWCEILEFWTV